VNDTHSPVSEAYRKLRTSLIFSQTTRELRKVVVTSSSAAEGKSTTAANLAISFAQQGMRVLIVDADLRRPSIHQIFRLEREPGLSELILDRATLEQVTQQTLVPNLWAVTAGVQPPNPAEMIAGPRMRSIIGMFDAQFDMIIFDTPPILAASEGPVLSVRSDGVVVVVRAGETDRRSVQLAVHQLRTVGANTLGVVLNDVDGKVPKYGYYDAYYYTYYGKEELVGGRGQDA
jgi:succinoglycan biosynthesis transport protein ExoP